MKYIVINQESIDLGYDVRENILDGCRYVYLDVGTNIGVQIRKLFEPDLYPNATVHQLFNKYFGDINERTAHGICAVGFEPNPSHTSLLKGNYALMLKLIFILFVKFFFC